MLFAGAPLAACGFTPVYGPNGAGSIVHGRIAYRAPDTPEGFRLRARLEDRLGRVEQGDYLLSVEMDIDEVALVITSDQDINRYNIPGTANWALYPAGADETSAPLASGRVSTFTAYSAFGTTVATHDAQQDARDRLSIALADLVVTDILIAAQGL